MAKLSRVAGSTGHMLTIDVQDSSKTDGSGLTGLTAAAAGLTCYYKRNTGTASVAVTLTGTGTLGTYTSGLFKEIDPTGMPGAYEFHPPDAVYAAGAKSVAIYLKGAANMARVPIEIELTGVDNQDPQRFGLAALPAAGVLAVTPTLNATQSFNNTGQTTNIPADLQTIKTQAVTAAAGVTFPASVGTSTFAGLGSTAPAGWINTAAFAAGATLPRVTLVDTVTTYTGNTPQTGDAYAAVSGYANLFTAGTVSTATSATSFVVAFAGSAPPAASLVGLWCSFVTAGRAPQKLPILTAAAVDGTHVTLTFAAPGFGTAPVLNDLVEVG